jgi:hypothetical protein
MGISVVYVSFCPHFQMYENRSEGKLTHVDEVKEDWMGEVKEDWMGEVK